MTPTKPWRPRPSTSGLRAGVATVTLAACAVLAAVATPMLAVCATPPMPISPAALAPADEETWPTTATALGVQRCDCRAGVSGSTWARVIAQAGPLDDARHATGRHAKVRHHLLYTSP